MAKRDYIKPEPTDKQIAAAVLNYGISIEQAREMLTIRKCDACGDPKSELVIDHDHRTSRVRGRLCRRCNRMLSTDRDNIEHHRFMAVLHNCLSNYLDRASEEIIDHSVINKTGQRSIVNSLVLPDSSNIYVFNWTGQNYQEDIYKEREMNRSRFGYDCNFIYTVFESDSKEIAIQLFASDPDDLLFMSYPFEPFESEELI